MWPALVLAVVSAAPTARAAEGELKPAAKAHLDRGLALYAEKDYEGAIRELSQGYAIDPKPELLYARAQAERLGGHCDQAIEHYEGFLATDPEPEREAAARANLAKCKDELAAKQPDPSPLPAPTPVPAPTVAPAPTPAPVRTAAPPPVREASPWYGDVFGDVLLGSGILATGVGGFFVLTSYASESTAKAAGTAPSGETYEGHQTRIQRAERQRTTGVIVGGVGLALIGGALLRYSLRDPSPPKVGLWVGPGQATVNYGRAF